MMKEFKGYNQICFPGCCVLPNGVRFYLETMSAEAGVILYDRGSSVEKKRIPFTAEDRHGRILCKEVELKNPEKIAYAFYEKNGEQERIFADPRARAFDGKFTYGEPRKELRRAILPALDFDWAGDKKTHTAYENSFWYLLHVRGFTKHTSSNVKNKGTFAGIEEKLDYLQSLGVTSLELQPVCDFDEMDVYVEKPSSVTDVYYPGIPIPEAPYSTGAKAKCNYWGYQEAYYYAPKAAYGSRKDVTEEFAHLVRTLHERGMELILQFFFPAYYPQQEMLSILRFWAVTYHVDGFRLLGERIPMQMLAADPVLADCKLVSDHLEGVGECNRTYYDLGMPRRMALSQDDFLYPVRRLLKGDEGMVEETLRMMRSNPAGFGRINYITSYRGFTLMDLFSYDRKHNEDNGEENRDGNDFNFSWNCGEEGPSRKRKVKELRSRQVRNALTILLLSAGTPEIFMGDEFGNSQKGNNNPYCIDSPVTWLDWKDAGKNPEIMEHLKAMTELRKANPILHYVRELTLMDPVSLGYPDLSYHGESAWRAQTEPYSRSMGILYSNAYAQENHGADAELLYAGINLHWNEKVLSLPRPPKAKRWKMVLTTGEAPAMEEDGLSAKVPPRSIVLFITEADPDYREYKAGKGRKLRSAGKEKETKGSK